jgi:hypothetical protein
MPEEIYENFLYIYAAFLEITAIIDLKKEKVLESPAAMMETVVTEAVEGISESENLSMPSTNSKDELEDLPPVALSKLCPICFGSSENESACICFDGNFQLKTLKPKGKAAKLNQLSARDLHDKRLFVDIDAKAPMIEMKEVKNVFSSMNQANLRIRILSKRFHARISKLPLIPKYLKDIVIMG